MNKFYRIYLVLTSEFYFTLYSLAFFNPFQNDSSKVKGFADNHFRFNENGRKFSKWIEDTVRKGDIAHKVFPKDLH